MSTRRKFLQHAAAGTVTAVVVPGAAVAATAAAAPAPRSAAPAAPSDTSPPAGAAGRTWIEANGISMHYQLGGSGPATRVLLHEMGLSLGSFDELWPTFTRTHRVLRYDLRGHGLTEKITYVYSFDDLAEDLRALLDVLGLTEPVTLIGGAIGGATAITFAAKYPKRVKAMVAYSPATGETVATRPREQELNNNILTNGVRKSVLAGEAVEYRPAIRTPERYRRYRGMKLANDLHGWVAARNMVVATEADDFLPRYAAVRCPTLVLASSFLGGKRPAAMVKAEVADRIKGAEFLSIESGHYMALERPDLLGPAVLDFLGRVGHGA